MERTATIMSAVVLIMSLHGTTWAQDKEEEEDESLAPSLPGRTEPKEQPPSVEELLQEHEDRIQELEAQLEEKQKQDSSGLLMPKVSFSGYADFGFFYPIGNEGAGWVRDFGNAQFPEFRGQYAWFFVGDILATTINTRGEAADLGDAPGAQRFDSVNSGGAPGFLINEVNFRTEVQILSQVILRTSMNVVPRTGNDFALGDFIELDLAEIEWVVFDDGSLSLWAGKVLPVFGIEYKERRSDSRFGITPSLIQRYTSGTQLGLKARSKLFNDWLILAASVTNGSSTTEQFHFYNEVDTNSGKTLNGRVAFSVPMGSILGALEGHRLEIGLSGAWGAQDRASNSAGAMWFVGADMQYLGTNFALKGQWMRGRSPGRPDDLTWGLELGDSGYLELDWMFLPYLGAIVRGGLRDAFVDLTNERAYLTKGIRITGGLRAVFGPGMVLKVEYLHNREYGGIAEFTNDIVTTSLVASY